MNTEKGQEGRVTIQQVKKERKETEKKDRNIILKHLFKQRSESVGSIDILNKRKGEEETDRKQREIFKKNLKKIRRVIRTSPKRKTTESKTEEAKKMERITQM